jgi:deoxyinosine 3'endonuclease (endonuclease V)
MTNEASLNKPTVGLAKTRLLPKPTRENPAHGPGWVLVSKPVGGLSSGVLFY